MRTTVTLDPDVVALVRRAMVRRGISFKQALNDVIRAGAARASGRAKHETPAFHMGRPTVPLIHALRLAGDLEDEEIARKLEMRK
jgi:hypothetical protein